MMPRYRAWLALGLLLQGCGAAALQHGDFVRVLSATADGTLASVREVGVSSKPTLAQQVRSIADAAMQQTQDRKLLLYLHGGLNSVSSSTKDSPGLLEAMTKDNYYPILVNWESGLASAYRSHLTRSATGRPSTWVHKATAPATFLFDLVDVGVSTPRSWYRAASDSILSSVFAHKQHDRALMGDLPFCDSSRGEEAEADPRVQELSMVCRRNDEWPSNGDQFGKSALWLALAPVRLVTTSIVYTIGAAEWKNMTRSAQLLFNTEDEFRVPPETQDFNQGALSALLDELVSRIDPAASQPLEVTLVGHSMGAIVINEILNRYVSDPRIVFDDVVYLGAASSTHDSLLAIVHYLHEHPDTRFHGVVLHPYAEDREREYATAVPDGSLLVWVDSMFQGASSFLGRTFGRWENLRPAVRLFHERSVQVDVGRMTADTRTALAASSSAPSQKRASMPGSVQLPLDQRVHFAVMGFGDDSPQRHSDLNDLKFRFWCPQFWAGKKVTADGPCIAARSLLRAPPEP
ncbi:MAG: hypothetical protein JWN04_1056 [Myxococcaceae bacterium]|nr:hypothetical protein [Myxococcaceae bacterium]